MPHNMRVIHAKEFMRTNVKGDADLKTSKRIIREIASLNLPEQCDLLIDIRDTVAKHSVADIYEMVGELVTFRKAFDGRKFAIVDDEDEFFYRNTKLAELCAQNRGINMRGFTNFEEAIRWLATETPLTPPDLPM